MPLDVLHPPQLFSISAFINNKDFFLALALLDLAGSEVEPSNDNTFSLAVRDSVSSEYGET
jgi:hypothetical protein